MIPSGYDPISKHKILRRYTYFLIKSVKHFSELLLHRHVDFNPAVTYREEDVGSVDDIAVTSAPTVTSKLFTYLIQDCEIECRRSPEPTSWSMMQTPGRQQQGVIKIRHVLNSAKGQANDHKYALLDADKTGYRGTKQTGGCIEISGPLLRSCLSLFGAEATPENIVRELPDYGRAEEAEFRFVSNISRAASTSADLSSISIGRKLLRHDSDWAAQGLFLAFIVFAISAILPHRPCSSYPGK